MASSAQTTGGFVDPYSYNYNDALKSSAQGSGLNHGVDEYWGTGGLIGLARKFFGDDVDWYKKRAETAAQQEYERQSIDSARAWSEYMDSTQYQRRVEDLKKAGLNPWLAVQNGLSGTGAPTVDTGGSAKNQSNSEQSSSWLAQLLMAIAKFVA